MQLMNDSRKRGRRLAIAIGVFGIAVELAAIFLLASRRISVPSGMPIMILGMFMAFVPAFFLIRSKRR